MWQIYDKSKTYTRKDYSIYTYEEFKEDYPTVDIEDFLVFLMGNVICEVESLGYIVAKYNIDGTKSMDEQLKDINNAYKMEEAESDPLERIASSLEYISMSIRNKEVQYEL